MKQLFASILLLSILVPLPFTTFLLNWEKYQLKKTVKSKLMKEVDLEDLKQFEFTFAEIKEDLDWEHRNEFEYRGVMYDVVHRKKTAEGFIFWCWEDTEETALNLQLEKITRLAWDQKNPQKKGQNLLSWMHHLFFIESEAEQVCLEETLKHPYGYTRNCKDMFYSPEVPPPNNMQHII